ncbi:hypothetical protein TNCV_1509751 [Trichonephila clavipes]|nr:hypothetical protein TNCV_1509751 [Trichonephila clavipes]
MQISHFFRNCCREYWLTTMHQNVWLMHDGGLAHSIAVSDHLPATHTGRWMRSSGPDAWHSSSPNLNPLGFFFWGHLKSHVYGMAEDFMALIVVSSADIISPHTGFV